MQFFGVCQLRDPLTDFQKNRHSWLRRGPHPHARIGFSRFKGGRVCACVKLSPSGVYFFSFFDLTRIATGRPVGPIVIVKRSNDASSWPSRPFYGFVNKKNIFPIFYPKMWKIALHRKGTLNSYNFGIIEDTYRLFAPNRGFSGTRNRMVSLKFTPDWPLLAWQPIVVISTQNWP